MITGILVTILLLILAVFIGLIIFNSIKVYHELEDGDYDYETVEDKKNKIIQKYKDQINDYRWKGHSSAEVKEYAAKLDLQLQEELNQVTADPKPRGHKGGLFSFIGAAVATIALLITIPGSFHQVEAGTYAVVKELGKIVEVRTPGTYFDFWMTRHYETYDATVQQIKINTQAYSKDGQTMDLEVYLQYQIQLDKLVIRDDNGNIVQTEGIAGKYVTLSSLQDRIETQCIEKTKAVMSSAEAMTIIQDRSKYSEMVSTTVRDAIGPDYYVNVQDVVLTNIDFTDEFEKAVEDKVTAEQEKQAAITRAEAEKEAAIIKAQQDLETAKLEAEAAIERAKGDAEAQIIVAEAAARAAASKIIELARSLGFPINETYTYNEDGEVIATQYTITYDADHTKENLDKLVISYLEYLAYLEQWDGKLPEIVAGEDALSILVPNSGNN